MKRGRFISIKRLLIVYSAFIILIFCTVVIFSLQSIKKTEQTLVENSENQLTFVNNSLETALMNVQFGVVSLLNNDVIYGMKYDVHSNKLVMNEMQKMIGASQSMGFSAIYWKDEDYFVMSNSLGIDSENNFHEKAVSLTKTGWYKIDGPSLYYATFYPFVSLKQDNSDYKMLGIGKLRQDYIYELLEANNSDNRIVNSLLFDDGEEISLSKIPQNIKKSILEKSKENVTNLAFKTKVDKQKFYVVAQRNQRSKTWVLTTIDLSLLSQNMWKTILVTSFCLIAFSVMAIMIVSIFYMRIYKNLNLLFEFFDLAEGGDYSYQPLQQKDADFAYIFDKYNDMLKNTDQLVNSLKNETKLRETAEYRQLQAQINPHFFYNNLLFIMSMADRSPNAVKLMTNHLAEYYRYVTKKNTQKVTLGQELNLAENYLTIISLRKSLDFNIDYPEEVLDEPFMQLIIQPIIENAVYHGVERRIGSHEVNITITRDEKEMKIEIFDDGAGMTQEEIDILLAKINQSEPEQTDSVGLWNVQHRLINKYGLASGLQFNSQIESLGYGLVVFFKVPLQLKGEEE